MDPILLVQNDLPMLRRRPPVIKQQIIIGEPIIERQTMEMLAVEKDGSVFVEGNVNGKPFSYSRELPPSHNNINNVISDVNNKNKKFRQTNQTKALNKKLRKMKTNAKKKKIRQLTKKVKNIK
jgi:hypothetical protein